MELPILWVPGCVVLPGQTVDVVLRGRGRARALWTAEEETQGRLVVAPGAFPPRKANELPAMVCDAGLRGGAPEGTRRLQGHDRWRVTRVSRSGRGRVAHLENFEEPRLRRPSPAVDSIRAAWTQLEQLRHARLPRSLEVEQREDDLAYFVASILPVTTAQRLAVLAEMDPEARLERALALLQAEVDVALLDRQILGLAD